MTSHDSAAWETERREALAVLRRVCGEFGDNDWPDELHLADIVELHLDRHLELLRGTFIKYVMHVAGAEGADFACDAGQMSPCDLGRDKYTPNETELLEVVIFPAVLKRFEAPR